MAAIGAALMGKVVSHSKAEQAFHPWWDDIEVTNPTIILYFKVSAS